MIIEVTKAASELARQSATGSFGKAGASIEQVAGTANEFAATVGRITRIKWLQPPINSRNNQQGEGAVDVGVPNGGSARDGRNAQVVAGWGRAPSSGQIANLISEIADQLICLPLTLPSSSQSWKHGRALPSWPKGVKLLSNPLLPPRITGVREIRGGRT